MTEISHSGHVFDIEIIDTAGQEEFFKYRDSSLAEGDAYLALYSINSLSSWQELKELRKKIEQEKVSSRVNNNNNNNNNSILTLRFS